MKKLFSLPTALSEVISSRRATSAVVVLMFGLVYFLLGLLRQTAQPSSTVFDFPNSEIALAVIYLALVPPVGFALNRISNPRRRVLFTLLLWLVSSYAAIWLSTCAIGILAGQPVPSSLLNSQWIDTLAMFSNVMAYSIFFASLFAYAEKSRALSRELARLQALRGGVDQQMQAERDGLVRDIQEKLQPAISEIESGLAAADTESIAKQARSAIDDLVIPLTRAIADSRELALADLPLVPGKRRVRLKDLFQYRLSIADLFPPLLSFAIFCLSIVSAYLYFYPSNGIVAGLIAATIIFLMQASASSLFSKTQSNPVIAFLIVLATSSLIATVAVGVSALVVVNPALGDLLFLGFGAFLVLAAAGTYVLVMEVGKAHLAGISRAADEFVSLLKRRDAQVRQLRTRVASTIHADVQGKLRALVLRIKTNDSASLQLHDLESDLNHITRVLTEIGAEQQIDFESELLALRQFWAGICRLDIEVSQPAVNHLEQNQSLAEAVLAVLTEAVANAIKHAEAKVITGGLGVTGDQLQLEVFNMANLTVDSGLSAGLGSQIYDQNCRNWTISLESGEFRFSAQFDT